jgi:hypothetical protein
MNHEFNTASHTGVVRIRRKLELYLIYHLFHLPTATAKLLPMPDALSQKAELSVTLILMHH